MGALLALALAAAAPDDLRADLATAERRQAAAERRAATLDQQAGVHDRKADEAANRLAALAQAARAAASEMATAQDALASAQRAERDQRARLAAAQAPLATLLAVATRLALRPPALAIAAPGSTRDAVHLHLLLAAARRALARRTGDIRGNLVRARRLRGETARALADAQRATQRLDRQRQALAAAARQERAAAAAVLAETAVARAEAASFAEEAGALALRADRIDDENRLATRLAGLPVPSLRPAFAQVSSPATTYRLPVRGRVAMGAGELTPDGFRARGLTLAPTAGSIAVAPAAGRVAYAGPFRQWRGIVILDHGHGWTTLLAGLDRTRLVIGDLLPAGAPLGPAGPMVTVELRHAGRPVDVAAMAAQ